MKYGKNIAEIHKKKLLRIGTVGNIPRPVVISNRLINVPKITYSASDYYYNYPLDHTSGLLTNNTIRINISVIPADFSAGIFNKQRSDLNRIK